MKVIVSDIVAVNPSVIRISVVSFTPAENEKDNTDYKYYELAIPIEEFTDNDGVNIGINGDKFQAAVSKRVVDAQLTANLAVYMENLRLEWILNIQEVPAEETVDNGMKLAFGEQE